MASSTNLLCGVCEAGHITKAADHWCPECEEGLCSDCQKHHSLSRATRKHDIIAIENYKNLPVFVAGISDNCKEHEMKFTNYCTQHDIMCCPGCLSTDHQKCTEIRLLTDFVDNAKFSTRISLIEDKIQRLKGFLNKGIQLKNENLTSLTNDREISVRQIKEFRNQINSYLDNLEKDLMAKLTETVDKTNKAIQQCTTYLTDSLTRIAELEKSTNTLKEFGSDLQTFFGTRKIDEKLDEETEKLYTIQKEGLLNLSNLNVKLNDELANTMSKLTTFGSVSLQFNPSSLQFPKSENKEAQIMYVSKTTPKSIVNIQLTIQCTIKIPTDINDFNITGCGVCPNGTMMFTDRNINRLIIFDQNGTLQSQITVIGGPRDVTVIDDTTAAVSTWFDGIKIIDVISKEMKQTIKTKNLCLGITHYKGSLLWCEASVGVQSKQLPDGDVCTLIRQKDLPRWSYITTHEDNIFFTNPATGAVMCYTIQGDKVWEYRDQSILRLPHNITTDNDSNIFITTSNQRGVFVMSPDGKRVKRLLISNDQLSFPTGIHFDIARNNLLITLLGGPAYLYHVSYDP